MSVQAMTWAFDQEIPPKPKMVLLALANRADRATGKCWPGLELLSRETSIPERTLIRHIHALVRNGYVIKEKSRGPSGTQRNNTYYLVMDREADRFGQWKFAATGELDDDDGDVCVEIDEAQDVVIEGAKMAPGFDVENSPPPGATGGSSPTAIGGSHQPSSEPKPKPTESESRKRQIGFSREAQDAAIDRQRLAALAEKAQARVFVVHDSKAWKAWCAYRGQHGQIASMPTMWETHEGKRRCGWYLPTLFPPSSEAEKESTEGGNATGPPT